MSSLSWIKLHFIEGQACLCKNGLKDGGFACFPVSCCCLGKDWCDAILCNFQWWHVRAEQITSIFGPLPPFISPPPSPPPPPHSSTTSAHGIAWKICSVSESGRLKFVLTTGKLWGLVHRRTVAMARTSYGCDCNLRPPTCIAMQKDQVQSKDHGVQVKVQWIVDPLK